MTKAPTYIAVALFGALSLATGAAMAQQQQRPPPPDSGAIAKALNLPADAVKSCLGDGPAQGKRPAKGEHPAPPDAGKIASCLGGSGHKVSTKSVDSALKSAAPARR